MSTRCLPTILPQPTDSRPRENAWYLQPIVWLGAAVLAASIAGCVWLIVVAVRYADPPLPVDGLQILKMPLTRPAQPTQPPPQKPGSPP
ncbi:MAG: hypothetical protein ABI343_12780 [Burkholderiaceae bacterium]